MTGSRSEEPSAPSGGRNEGASRAALRRAQRVLVGGVNSPVRAMTAIGRDPLFIARGEGAELVDLDGNRYIDYVCSWGPLIHGHAHPEIVAAVGAAAERGTSFGAATLAEVELAEEVGRRMPGAEMMRMTSSGTEATMTALRLARAITGRERVLKFAGAYHGHVDGLLAQGGSGLATQGIPSSPGVSQAAAATTVVIPFNDPEALRAALEPGDLAAVLLEIYPANMGLIEPEPEFLALLGELAEPRGTLVVADEVITGFRVGRGGAQERAGLRADLIVIGKVLGGGLPAAAVAGPARLLSRLAPVGDVYQAGTLSGNPLAVAAGLATLELLDEAAYARLASLTETLASGLREAAGDRPVQVVSVPGLLTVFFSEHVPSGLEDVRACELSVHAAWCRALLERGVYPPPSQFEAWFPSLAHDDEHIERTVTAAGEAFRASDLARLDRP